MVNPVLLVVFPSHFSIKLTTNVSIENYVTKRPDSFGIFFALSQSFTINCCNLKKKRVIQSSSKVPVLPVTMSGEGPAVLELALVLDIEEIVADQHSISLGSAE